VGIAGEGREEGGPKRAEEDHTLLDDQLGCEPGIEAGRGWRRADPTRYKTNLVSMESPRDKGNDSDEGDVDDHGG
jgi:hypothetical protein